ncbi:MAG: EAL domain-containing protein [Sulfurisoma sp.]|nr:EAL domain-containing protein [Sulfurisoma sp.]
MNKNPDLPDTQWLLYQAAEQSPLPIMVTDGGGRIVYANPALVRATGYERDELIGANPRIFRSGQTPPDTYRQLWATLLAGETWEGELFNRSKSGELYAENLHIAPIRDATGGIGHFFAIRRNPVEHHAMAGRIEYLSSVDALTGLPNRNRFMMRLAESMQEAALHGTDISLLHIDLDDFKSFNDSLGQRGADRLLETIANRLKDLVRSNDVLARLGGDKFALLLWDAGVDLPQHELLARIQAGIAEPVELADGHSVTVTACTGVAVYPRDGCTSDALLQAAEVALQSAKQAGHGQARIFEPSATTGRMTRVDMAAQLRHVAERGELVLHFQPQLSLYSGEIVGAEALVRWRHPDRGMIPPGDFIPFAEETGLIVPISEWVLRAACRQAAEWRQAGLRPLTIGVNLSARHFRHADLPDTVAAVLDETAMEPRQLDLELTESAMMHDTGVAIRIVDRLKELGVRLSLDDFGTGYSSLAYLSRFAIDRLKIDQSFVRDVTDNPVNASIVTATIAMAHQLGKGVVAEGVETEAQMNFLRRHDCDEMQGYFFSRPLPAEEFAALLADGRRLELAAPAAGEAVPTLLLVDDEPSILNALKRVFRNEGYRLLTAAGGREGLELLALHPVQVIVSDQRMPEMSGVEFLSRARQLYPRSIRIVLSGYAEIGTVTDAVNRGAISKFFTKPWDDDDLREEIRRAFRSTAEAGRVLSGT